MSTPSIVFAVAEPVVAAGDEVSSLVPSSFPLAFSLAFSLFFPAAGSYSTLSKTRAAPLSG